MPTGQQLEAEPWWFREIITAELDWLGDEICRRVGRPRDAFGTKGNYSHLSGGHRSQEWILNSDYCSNTSYTVQSGLSGEQPRHIAAADFTPGAWGTSANRALVAAQTRALWDAAKRGELTGVRQIQGTLDGRMPIGLNVLSGSTMTPDSSHLDHWHLTFDRKYMRDAGLMSRIADLVGGDMPTEGERNIGYAIQNGLFGVEEPVAHLPAESGFPAREWPSPFAEVLKALVEGRDAKLPAFAAIPARTWVNGTSQRLTAIEAKLAGLAQPAPAVVDVAALVAALRPELEAAAERAVRKVLGKLDEPTV